MQRAAALKAAGPYKLSDQDRQEFGLADRLLNAALLSGRDKLLRHLEAKVLASVARLLD